MKKSKFLALVLAVAVMLMGAGYAYWTDSIKINNTVNTGNLEVKLENGTLTLPDYVNGTAVVDAAADSTLHTAKVTLNNLYPGAKVHVSIPFKNVGTIPVKFKEAPTNTAPTSPTGSDLANYITIDNWSYTNGNILPDANGNIEFDITVNTTAPNNTTENTQATFDVNANFIQWK